jgi:hypothetical protein
LKRLNHTASNRSYEIVFTPPASNALKRRRGKLYGPTCVDGKPYDFSFTAKWADDGSTVFDPFSAGGYLDPFVLYGMNSRYCGKTAKYTAETIVARGGRLWERVDPIEHCVAKPAAGEDLQRTVGVAPKADEELPSELSLDIARVTHEVVDTSVPAPKPWGFDLVSACVDNNVALAKEVLQRPNVLINQQVQTEEHESETEEWDSMEDDNTWRRTWTTYSFADYNNIRRRRHKAVMKAGNTALDMAIQSGATDVARVLREHGAKK